MLLKAEKQYRIKDIMNCLPKFFLQFLLLVSCVFFLIFIWACLLELCFALVVGGVSLIFDGISVVLVHHRMLSSGEGACGDLCLFSLMPNFHVNSLKYYLMKFWDIWAFFTPIFLSASNILFCTPSSCMDRLTFVSIE